ncbi:MAG: hypothetical protein ACREQ4_08200 [Candidatus Binataceae bacterium]
MDGKERWNFYQCEQWHWYHDDRLAHPNNEVGNGVIVHATASSSSISVISGVWFNNTSATVKNAQVSGNTLIGTNLDSDAGVWGEDNAGTISGINVGMNFYSGWPQNRAGHINALLTGIVGLSSGIATVTFPNGITYDAAPLCSANDQTAAAAVKVTSTTTTVALAGRAPAMSLGPASRRRANDDLVGSCVANIPS